MPSPAQLRRFAAAAEKRAQVLAVEAELLKEQARQLREMAAAAEGLTIAREGAIDRHVNQAALAQIRRDRTYGRPIESKHPFAQALKEARISVQEWADIHKVTRSRVKSWMLDDDKGGRPIPRAYAKEIAKDFDVPLTAWKNGIKD